MMVASEVRNHRHKTAMRRNALSRPVGGAIKDRILKPEKSFFDYGCGFGSDIEILKSSGFTPSGWDPFYFPNNKKASADVVNLGFVLNVIEDPTERTEVLKEAFELAKECLIASVRIDSAFFEDRFGDGAITKDGAFQKIYSQAEFRAFVESNLGKKIYFTEPGIGYVFKSDALEHEFKSGRYLNRLANHDEAILKKIHEAIDAERIARLIEDLGRIPGPGEISELAFLGKRKFKDFIESTVLPSIDKDRFESSRERIRQDILQALAMTRIENRAFLPQRDLSLEFQHTLKEMFGEYREACRLSEEMLFRLGKEGEVLKAAKASVVGKLLPEDLYIHRSAVEYIPGLLKLMLSLGESIVGRVNSDLIKFSLHGKSMSFLFYGNFDEDPHPSIQGSIRVDFRTGKNQARDYSKSENPPILHRKDTFVLPSYERYEEFKNLTLQEEAAGLLGGSAIGFRKQWEELLQQSGYYLDGHQLKALTS